MTTCRHGQSQASERHPNTMNTGRHPIAVINRPPISVPTAGPSRYPKLRGAWEGGALADSEQQSQRQKCREAGGKSGHERRDRPHRHPDGQHSMRPVPFGEPTGRCHCHHISVVEGGQQHPKLARAQVELILHERRRRREIAAVNIVNEHRGRDQQYEARCGRGHARQSFASRTIFEFRRINHPVRAARPAPCSECRPRSSKSRSCRLRRPRFRARASVAQVSG
jgi:hypothetical protein